ncbi:MAG: hypothetical protein V4605_05095 [Pseudomonadota bacterium]
MILGFCVSVALGFYLGGTHHLILDINRLGTKALLPTIGMVMFFLNFLVTLLAFKLAQTTSSPTPKKIFSKLATVTYFLMLCSAAFTPGIIGIANRI